MTLSAWLWREHWERPRSSTKPLVEKVRDSRENGDTGGDSRLTTANVRSILLVWKGRR
jgi:hypothetical protein